MPISRARLQKKVDIHSTFSERVERVFPSGEIQDGEGHQSSVHYQQVSNLNENIMAEEQQNEYVVEEDIDFVLSMDPAIVTMPYDVEIFINELRDFPCIWDTCILSVIPRPRN